MVSNFSLGSMPAKTFSMPSLPATFLAVKALSPVSITGVTPAFFRLCIACAASSFTVSLRAINPT